MLNSKINTLNVISPSCERQEDNWSARAHMRSRNPEVHQQAVVQSL